MSVTNRVQGVVSAPGISDPEQLCELLEIPFSDEQLAAITAPLEPAVVMAGAGSGKTTVMAARVVWLVATGQVRPDQVLGLTFTRKAAGELSARVEKALAKARAVPHVGPDDAGEQLVMTYDAFAARLVSDHGLRIGAESDRQMITGATRFRLAARVVADAPGPFQYLSRLRPDSITERVIALDEQMQQHLVTSEQVRAWTREYLLAIDESPRARGGRIYSDLLKAQTAAWERVELLGLVEAYQRAKERAGVIEFADQMAIAARLAHEVPTVGAAVRKQFSVVLLDEYQDTSSAQAQLLRSLFSDGSDPAGLGHPVTAVGDPYQAIYGWRGAAPSNILQFSSDFHPRDGSPAPAYPLTVNRRSDRTILETANDLAAPLRADERLQVKQGGGVMDTRLTAPPGAADGIVSVASFASWPEEVTWLADRVVEAHESGEVPSWSEIAVLVRRNLDVAPLYDALTERDVPVEIVGLGGLLRLHPVSDVVDTLALINDVTDNSATASLLSGPRWRIGPRDLAVLGQRANELAARQPSRGENSLDEDLARVAARLDDAEELCLLDAVEDPGEAPLSEQARERLAKFGAELTRLRAHGDEPVLELTHRIIRSMGLEAELRATRPERLIQLSRFTDAVADYTERDGDATLAGLLAWFDVEIERGTGLDQAVVSYSDAVPLMTVHRAKGLEWDMVFLPSMVDNVFPNDRISGDWVKNASSLPADLRGDREWLPAFDDVSNDGLKAYRADSKVAARQAEDRLAYVAATRARHQLFVTAHYWVPTNKDPRDISDYFTTARSIAAAHGVVVQEVAQVPERPESDGDAAVLWPEPVDPQQLAKVQEVVELVRVADEGQPPALTFDEAAQAQEWADEAAMLLKEATERRAAITEVKLPESISASSAMMAKRDPEAFLGQLIRPMPRQTSKVASVGSRFHHWLEKRFDVAAPIDELIARSDELDTVDQSAADQQFARLCAAFDKSSYADRVPAHVEEPFILVLTSPDSDDSVQVRGRIDAIYQAAEPFTYQVVDWKTSNAPADPQQLAIYRLAWAQITGIPIEKIDAVFVHVASGKVERPKLPSERQLVAALGKAGYWG